MIRNQKKLILAMAIMALGCGSKYELAPVTGKVTIDGSPYPGGKVIFYPVASEGEEIAGRPSFGIPNAEGGFYLSCLQDGDGAMVGEHTVTLFRSANHEEVRPDLKELKFNRVNLPEGRITVVAGENVINVELTSEHIQKYGNRL